MPVLYDQHGFPIPSTAELGQELSNMPYDKAMEALYLLEDSTSSRGGIFAGEDYEWAGLDMSHGEADRDALDWDSVQRASQLAYKYWIYNPLVRRGVETITQYVFGRGFDITSEDETVRSEARDMWANYDVQRMMSGANGIHRHCSLGQVHGNLFFALFPPGSDAKKIRRFEMSQVHQVLYDEWNDPVMWLISYRDPLKGMTAVPERRWVKSIHFKDRAVSPPSGYEEQPLETAYYMHHMAFGSLIGSLGLPTFWPAIPWAKAYKAFLEDFAVISRALRTFAWRVTGSGFDSLSSAKSMVTDAYTKADQSAYGVGNAATLPDPNSNIAPIRTANYTTPADGGRRLALMAMAAFGLPETYFGDVSVGTYATASTMERPVELMMRYVQEVWAREIETMLSFLIDGDPENQKKITVKFPPILEHDALPLMQALKTVGELEYQSLLPEDLATEAMQALGINDTEERIERMRTDGYFDTTRQEQSLKLQQQYAPDPMSGGGGPSARELGKNYPRKDKPKGRGMPRKSSGS